MLYDIALVGASGLVGRETLKILEERNFPVRNLYLIASAESVGKTLSFRGGDLAISAIDDFDFSIVGLAIFCVPTAVSIKYVEKATAQGAIVIDNSTHYRTDPDVPVIIPEVNAKDIELVKKKMIIANSNCAAIQMLVAIKPLHDYAKIKRIVVSTYQSVSGWGKDAMDELESQAHAVIENKNIQVKHLPKQIAFNIVPQIDRFTDDGSTIEEWKIAHDTAKILDPNIKVSATAVRVPVMRGHSESINMQFEKPITPQKATEILSKAPGIRLIDEPTANSYATPVESTGKDWVAVSRIRRDPTVENGLNIWVVSDNIRKGAALNTMQIAEELIKRKLI